METVYIVAISSLDANEQFKYAFLPGLIQTNVGVFSGIPMVLARQISDMNLSLVLY